MVSQTVTFELPPCPLSAVDLDQAFNFTLPADSPVPAKTSIKGTVAVVDPSGATLAHVTLDVSVQ